MTTYTVPTVFYEDHVSRGFDTGTVLIKSTDKCIVALDEQGLNELIGDASFYSEWDEVANPQLADVIRSAKATVGFARSGGWKDQETWENLNEGFRSMFKGLQQ